MNQQAVSNLLDAELFRSGDSDYMVSLARGLHVIQVFCDGERSRLTIADITRTSGLSRTVVSRCLYTLQELGFVGREGREYYLLPKVLRLGYGYVSTASLPALAQPLLDSLTAETGLASAVTVLDNADALYVATSRPSSVRNAITINTTIGHRRPAYVTSSGMLLLATLSRSDLEAYFARLGEGEIMQISSRTETQVRALIDGAARDGYILSELPFATSMRGLAVPVRNVVDRVVAALVIAIFDTKSSDADLAQQYLPKLNKLAKGLADKLID